MASVIAQIVDYSAWKAGHDIQGLMLPNGSTIGVRATFGVGQSFYPDPLRPDPADLTNLQPAPENPFEPYTHFSDLPDAPTLAWLTQDGAVQLDWDIPMRLWLPRSSLAVARQTAMPFYFPYLRAFFSADGFGGLCTQAWPVRFSIGGDEDWNWLDVALHVQETVFLDG